MIEHHRVVCFCKIFGALPISISPLAIMASIATRYRQYRIEEWYPRLRSRTRRYPNSWRGGGDGAT